MKADSVPIIPYARQTITEADIEAVVEVLRADFITQGPRVVAFEEAFAAYVGARYAVAVSSGTAALHLCALALDVGPTSRVMTTPITFAASANCIRYCNGNVTFADVDPETILLDPEAVRAVLEAAPSGTYAGIIAVDFAGCPVRMDRFRDLADAFGLWLIEDACHAPGGSFVDQTGTRQRCGNGVYADLAIFSFHPVKHIACGEGGMITTNDEELAHRLRRLRMHGVTKAPEELESHHGGWYYEMQELGYNYRLTDLQCALGSSQLTRAAEGLARRRELARRYDEAFADTSVRPVHPVDTSGGLHHAYHLYPVRVNDRKGLYDHLRTCGIYAQVHYIPVHMQPYYYRRDDQRGEFPHAEAYYDEALSLPMYPALSDEAQHYVIESVLNFVGED